MLSRAKWYTHLNNPSRTSVVAWIVNLVIACAVTVHILEILMLSVDQPGPSLYAEQRLVQIAFTFIFMVDFMLRCWVAADAPSEHGVSEAKRRMHYVLSPMGVIDLLSFLPGLVMLMIPDMQAGSLSFLKIMAIIRVLKLTRYSTSLAILGAVYRENFSTLFAAMMIMLVLSFTAATGVYLFEYKVQPESFGSVPDAMWWALVTLTTVGYGDVVPVTLAGKMFGSLVMLAGVGMAAIPAGVFASSFVRLIREREMERRLLNRRRQMSSSDGKLHTIRGLDLSAPEKGEVDFLMSEYALSLEQAVSVVEHYRH